MGCSQSNLVSPVVSTIETKPQPSFTIPQQIPSNQQSDRILENCIIVWLLDDHPSVNIENEKFKLRQIVSFIKTFTDSNECITYIKNIRIEKIFLIVSNMNLLDDSFQYLPQIEKIYIFSYQTLSSNTFHDLDSLCKQLQVDVELCELDLIDIITSCVPTQNGVSSNESKKQETLFLYVQLMREILFRIKLVKTTAKDEFAHFCRRHYSNNDEQLHIINDFEIHYRPQKSLQWLKNCSFILKILRRIQRTPELDIHYKMCFFLKDVYAQLNIFQENNNSFMTEKTWTVYRGKTFTKDQFDILIKNNCNGLLSFSSLFTANKNQDMAVNFIYQRLLNFPHRIGILFIIHINSTIRSARSPFASFDEIESDETYERNGILFSMYTVFRIESIEQIVTEKSISMWTVKLTLIDDDNPQLLRIISPLRSSEVHASPVSYLGKLFIDRGDYEYAEYFFLEMLQDTTIINQPSRLARIHKGLGSNYMNTGEYIQALKHYQQALEVSLNYLSSFKHIDLIPLYDGIGNSYYKQGDYVNALKNYEKAIDIITNNKQLINEQLTNDLNIRIETTKKILSNKI